MHEHMTHQMHMFIQEFTIINIAILDTKISYHHYVYKLSPSYYTHTFITKSPQQRRNITSDMSGEDG